MRGDPPEAETFWTKVKSTHRTLMINVQLHGWICDILKIAFSNGHLWRFVMVHRRVTRKLNHKGSLSPTKMHNNVSPYETIICTKWKAEATRTTEVTKSWDLKKKLIVGHSISKSAQHLQEMRLVNKNKVQLIGALRVETYIIDYETTVNKKTRTIKIIHTYQANSAVIRTG